ncbi:hypothetical protein TNCV_2148141 [Trichonephila clavipes]|uniref:Uncharacterized protein n=1 Tax=Trichonephila clavipes TaxID=2585209 RepID=A0A8X6T4N8_TRICX|nr:hypothetical protein TNCV_2148141 [Trichonephila clavipes]
MGSIQGTIKGLVTFSRHAPARSARNVDSITQSTSTRAPLKYCGVLSSDITPTTKGREKINVGFHLEAGTRSVRPP